MPGGVVVQELEDLSLTLDEAREILRRAGFKDEACLLEEWVGGHGGLSTAIGIGLFCALGGALFGLDMGYISGVESMGSLCDDLLDGKRMDAVTMGMVTGIFAVGAIIAAFPPVINAAVNRLGREGCIVLGGVIFCLGAILQTLAPHLAVFYVGRLIAGASVGLLSSNIPVYQGEIAPKSARGMIVTLYQLSITVGIMVAFWINFALRTTRHGWRYSVSEAWPCQGLLACWCKGVDPKMHSRPLAQDPRSRR
ncbi:unnamed protein product [Polarella glacialis]|uniref:Hexose transporter 1 n=1 Tax=Polarella glacialis TaxID=89957 RepID=A0A813EJQ8_POLGL|nr:unnamed protein product [Polarella glacialis]